MRIEDNGVGFDPQRSATGNGLKNISNRVIKWYGRYDIKSAAGGGTLIEISIPHEF